MIYRIRYVFFFLVSVLYSYDEDLAQLDFKGNPVPWMTGPLLGHSGAVVRTGRVKLHIYSSTRVHVAKYDGHWSAQPEPNFYSERLRCELKVGLGNRLDFQIEPLAMYNETEHRHSFNIADTAVLLNVQVLEPRYLGSGPSMKFGLAAILPTGKYDQLRKSLLKTDATGVGCWYPGFVVAGSNLWHISGIQYLQFRFSTQYHFGVPVHVKGYSYYDGNASTNGTVIPGNYYDVDFGFQYSLTQNWVAAFNIIYEHKDVDRFSGKSTSPVGKPSEETLMFAPAIEYNWAVHQGMNAGLWFSAAGRNTHKFFEGVITYVTIF